MTRLGTETMPAPRTLLAQRLHAASARLVQASTTRWWVGTLLLVLCTPALVSAQTAPRSARTNASSRLVNPPESVDTPRAEPAPSVAPGETVYEFETGGGSGEEIYYEGGPGPGVYDDGTLVDGEFDAGPSWDSNGYLRYGPGFFLHPFRCHQLYLRADYLLWWGKGFTAPPLVTTSAPGTSLSEAGELGLASTSILFPGDSLTDGSQSGGRARIGYWFDPCDTLAVEGTYFAIGQATTNFNASDLDYPILARPFVNVTTNFVGNDALLIGYPGVYSGNIAVASSSSLQGVEVLVRRAMCRGCDWRIDWTLGWRYNRLDDNLNISTDRVSLVGVTALTAATLTEWDRFSTVNWFNGLQLGMITEIRRDRWWFETRASLALGNNRAQVNIDGQSTSVTPGGLSVTSPGGLLTQPTNIGEYYNDNFAMVPQLGVNMGFEITCGLWATVGYNFMYWSQVARPGDQIDPDINLSQDGGGSLLGLPRPGYTGLTTDYWAQGLNFGLAYRY